MVEEELIAEKGKFVENYDLNQRHFSGGALSVDNLISVGCDFGDPD